MALLHLPSACDYSCSEYYYIQIATASVSPSLVIVRSSNLHLLRYVDLVFLGYMTVYLL